jgi:hypothetical protein
MGEQMSSSGTRLYLWAGLVVWAVGAFAGLNYLRLNWTLDPDGLSIMTGRLPFWDFTNLWGGGRMALEGHVGYLFSPDLYRSTIRAMLSPHMLDQEWSYPPSMLLIGAPLAALPILPAYLAWNAATLYFLFVVSGWLGLPAKLRILAMFAPPVAVSVIMGQNGALTASLLLGGLFLAPRRPVAAGFLLGLLTVKPHLGNLVPFCLLASGNWRTILSASLTAMAIAGVTAVIFGWDVWRLFLTETGPLMRSIMEAPYPQGYHMNAMTFFILARALGADIALAYGTQAIFTAGSVAVAIWLWRTEIAGGHELRVALTGLLALCATPYVYTYDAIPLSMAVMVLLSRNLVSPLLLAVGWLQPLMNHVVARDYISVGALIPAIIVATALIELWRRQGLKPENQGQGD